MTMTDNNPSVINFEESTVSRTISIAAPVDKVWAAITQAEHLKQWFPQDAELGDLAIGGAGAFTFEGYGTFPFVIEELDPPRSIAYRWSNENGRPVAPIDLAHSTVFRFTLEEIDGGTQLTVVESGFENLSDPAASLEGNRGGWDFELDELVAYLEGSS